MRENLMVSSPKVLRIVLQSVIDSYELKKCWSNRQALAKAMLVSRFVQKNGMTKPEDVLRVAKEVGCKFQTAA